MFYTVDVSFMKVHVFISETQFPTVFHSLCVWHKAKNMASALKEMTKKAANKSLREWEKDIIDHFW